MQTQTKRYKLHTTPDNGRERQLSSLFYIVSSNLLVATKLLRSDHPRVKTKEMETLSQEARLLANELLLDQSSRDSLLKKITYLKHEILEIVSKLSEELINPDIKMHKEDIVVVRRLLRESQRGLATVQD